MTAEEFIYYYNDKNNSEYSLHDCNTKMMIEFARYHVEKALYQASIKVEIDSYSDNYTDTNIIRNAVLEAYSLENIK